MARRCRRLEAAKARCDGSIRRRWLASPLACSARRTRLRRRRLCARLGRGPQRASPADPAVELGRARGRPRSCSTARRTSTTRWRRDAARCCGSRTSASTRSRPRRRSRRRAIAPGTSVAPSTASRSRASASRRSTGSACAPSSRHLAGRIVIDREKPMAATLAAQRVLRQQRHRLDHRRRVGRPAPRRGLAARREARARGRRAGTRAPRGGPAAAGVHRARTG